MHTRDFREHPPWRAIANAGLGVWVMLAAFLLPRGYDSTVNTFVVGALVVIAALSSVHQPLARHVAAALAGWLFFSAFALFLTGTSTLLHDLVVSFAIFAIALTPAAALRRAVSVSPGPGPSTSG